MIYIVRHGQTERNNAFVLQGRSNDPLNERGVQQARELGEWFAEQGITFERVFSSPLIRTVQTAKLAAPGVEVETDIRLIEMDYGPYEGADLKEPAPELITFFSDFVNNPAPEGMEPLSEVVRRTGEFIEEVAALSGGSMPGSTAEDAADVSSRSVAEAGSHGNIMVSTHAIAMKGILEYLTPDSQGGYWSKYLGNCAVYIVDDTDGHLGVPYEVRRNDEGNPEKQR